MRILFYYERRKFARMQGHSLLIFKQVPAYLKRMRKCCCEHAHRLCWLGKAGRLDIQISNMFLLEDLYDNHFFMPEARSRILAVTSQSSPRLSLQPMAVYNAELLSHTNFTTER